MRDLWQLFQTQAASAINTTLCKNTIHKLQDIFY